MKQIAYFILTFLFLQAVYTPLYAQRRPDAKPDSIELKLREAYTKREVMIPMRDGVKLYTAIYEPQKQYKYSASYFVSAVDGFSMKDSLTATYQTLRALRTVALSVNPAGEGVAEAMDLLEQYVAQYNEKVEAANEGNERVVEQTFAHFGLEETSELVALLPSPCGIKRREDGECL